MTTWNRRGALGVLGAAALSSSGCVSLTKRFFTPGPPVRPPVGTRAFVRRMFDGLDRAQVWDSHVHVVGNGATGSGCWVSPKFKEELQTRVAFYAYLSAGGDPDETRAEVTSVERAIKLHRLMNPAGKMMLMGFDFAHDDDGSENRDKSEFFTPNDWVFQWAERFPTDIAVTASIHPYRKDALDQLDAVSERGAVAIKWLPNSQRIDVEDPRAIAFAERMKAHDLVLISHAGEEQAVESEDAQALGNPLKFRKLLDTGVRVVLAHCAGLGEGENLDRQAGEDAVVDNFDLFMKLMEREDYASNLFADISAMTQFNRAGRPLREMMRRTDLHPRLINGSDYPLPALKILILPRLLREQAMLDDDDTLHLEKVFDANPLLFDFCVKRALRFEEDGVVHRFSDVVFESRRVFPRAT